MGEGIKAYSYYLTLSSIYKKYLATFKTALEVTL